MKQPSIIFLNGPTGSGKSSIAKALQVRLLPVPFMHISIDMMIDMMPEGINNWQGKIAHDGFWWKITTDSLGNKLSYIQIGPYAEKVCESLKDIAITLLKKGHNLIIDEICLLPGSFASWQKMLSPFNTIYVGLSAPLDVLEMREAKRGDRMIGSAKAQYEIVHKGNSYDLSLDTNDFLPEICAEKITNLLIRH